MLRRSPCTGEAEMTNGAPALEAPTTLFHVHAYALMFRHALPSGRRCAQLGAHPCVPPIGSLSLGQYRPSADDSTAAFPAVAIADGSRSPVPIVSRCPVRLRRSQAP